MNTAFKLETDLYEVLIIGLQKRQLCFAEVPFFGKSVDIVFTTKTFRRITAVEVKLDDWRVALKQASINQLFACYSYIAVPGNLAYKLDNDYRSIFVTHGVGIIGIDRQSTVVIEARKSEFIYQKHRSQITKILSTSSDKTPKDLKVVTNALANRNRSLELLQVGTC